MVFCNLSDTFKKIALIFCSVLFFNGTLLAGTYQERSHDTTLNRLLADPPIGDPDPGYFSDSVDTEANTARTYIPVLPVLRNVPDSVIKNLQGKKEFEYANDPAYWEREKEKQEVEVSGSVWWLFSLLKYLIYFALIAVLVYAFYRVIVTNKLHLFYSSSKKIKGDAEDGEITDENLDEKIREYVNAGEYRNAVRYMYLKALRLLDDKGWIHFNAKNTNIDYVNALSKRPAGDPFRMITRNYEYVWYGEFELNAGQFDYLRKKFEEFYNSLK